jgi:aspartate carbamoyltransferase regulatory subunit
LANEQTQLKDILAIEDTEQSDEVLNQLSSASKPAVKL